MRSSLFVLVTLTFCVVCRPELAAQTRPAGPYTWTGVYRAIAHVELPIIEAAAQSPRLVSSGREAKRLMDELNRVWFNAPEPRLAYLMDMTLDAYLLQLAGRMPEERAYEAVNAVSEGIAIRLLHSQKHPRRTGSDVFVRAQIRGTNSLGWRVLYVSANRRRFLNDPGEQLGTVLSSPYTEGLVPIGKYVFWATKGSIESPIQEFTVGGDGKDEMSIELKVPESPRQLRR